MDNNDSLAFPDRFVVQIDPVNLLLPLFDPEFLPQSRGDDQQRCKNKSSPL
jgi:hypothetical protein